MSESWPASWKRSYSYDLVELYARSNADVAEVAGWGYVSAYRRGYVYAYWTRVRQTIAAVRRFAPAGASIIDVAAGPGNISLALAEIGYDVTWNDLREELAEYVRLKHERGVLRFAPGNLFELSYEEAFDVALMTEIIEHVAHPDLFLAKVAKLVKPGGFVVMTTPNGEYWSNRLPKFSACPDPSVYEQVQFQPDAEGHIFLLHTDEVPALAEQAGLAVRELRVFNNTLTSGFAKTEALLWVLPPALVRGLESLLASGRSRIHRKLNRHMLAVFQRPSLSHPASVASGEPGGQAVPSESTPTPRTDLTKPSSG